MPDAIDQAVRHLQSAAEHIHNDSDDLVLRAARTLNETAVSLADQVRRLSSLARHEADRDVRAHPLAIAAAVATLAGLVVVSLVVLTTPAPRHS